MAITANMWCVVLGLYYHVVLGILPATKRFAIEQWGAFSCGSAHLFLSIGIVLFARNMLMRKRQT